MPKPQEKDKKSLLDSDSESDSDSEEGKTEQPADTKEPKAAVTFAINTQYAQDYQSRKQREELQRERQRRGDEESYSSDDSSSSEEEDEDAALLTPKLDVDILKTINALRSKDKRIYDPNARFFPGSEEEDEESSDDDEPKEGSSKTKQDKTKPKRAKDVIREQILEQIEEEETGGNPKDEPLSWKNKDDKTARLAYDEQQQELRKAFLDKNDKTKSGDDDDDPDKDEDDDFLVIKKRHNNDTSEMDEDARKEFEEELKRMEDTVLNQKGGDKRRSSLVDPRGEVQDGDRFLLDFIKNKSWVDKTDHVNNPVVNSDSDDDSLEQLEKMDEFEHNYNFRFEEAVKNAEGTSGADHSVMGYARSQTMNTLRRKDETRREKRLARQERKAAERKAKEEKLRRLKNARREEMEKKLQQVKAVLGAKAEEAGEAAEKEAALKDAPIDEAAILKLLEGDYDPEKFEKSMQEAFGDDFYSKEETEWKTDEDVEQTLKRDGDVEFFDADDDDGEEDDNQETGADYEEDDLEGEQEDPEVGDDEDFDDDMDEEERAKETELEQKLRQKMEDKLYELDYEDIVAGMPTRFKYRQVEPNNYGLTTEEILLARDSTLKQYVSLKKMAPYREGEEYQVSGRKRRKFRELLQQDIEEANQKLKERGITVNDNQGEDGRGPEGSRKKRKRRRLKKGTKDSKATAASNEPEKKEEEEKESPSGDEIGAGDSKKKRRRKKKGKKTDSGEGSEALETSKSENSKLVEPPEVKATATTESSQPKSRSESEIKKKSEKKKKQKEKKKKIAVEGVPVSRLASYGL